MRHLQRSDGWHPWFRRQEGSIMVMTVDKEGEDIRESGRRRHAGNDDCSI